MTSLEEAYLPLEKYTNHDDKLKYLKDIYNSIDSLNPKDVNIDDFDPSLLVSQCEMYRSKMSKYMSLLKEEQADLIHSKEKLDVLQSCQSQLKEICNSEEIQNTLGGINDLSSSLHEAQEKLERKHAHTFMLYRQLFKASTHYVNNDPRRLCPICIINEIDTAIVPCGHTICGQCSLKCDTLTCYVCRNKIEKVMKLYFI